MRVALACLAAAAALTLAACADRDSDMSPSDIPDLPLQTPLQAEQAPIVALGDTIHVGADVAPPADALTLAARHGNAGIAQGAVQDGVGGAELIAYLQADATLPEYGDDEDGTSDVTIVEIPLLRFRATPPTVYVAEGTPPALVDDTVRAVQAINAALPENWQLGFNREPATEANIGDPEGKILVRFALQIEWPQGVASPTDMDVGLAIPTYAPVQTGDPASPPRFEIVAGRVFVDHTQTEGLERLGVIAHEIIHLLGRNHVDAYRFPQTIMVDGGSKELSGHILHALDREALLAVYGSLDPETLPSDIAAELGDWSDTSLHVRGAIGLEDGDIAFGSALRNGLSQPWASGPTPHANLEDNTALSGSVSWSGRLIGLTPQAEAVAGAAELSVDVETLSGSVDFTGLERWAADAAPGDVGTGATWLDGDLSYAIQVRGNTFVQTSGDAGTVTGAFFGPAHEGMGGVLERTDLSAGFGGER